jgi:hypothetical protein
LAEITKPLFFVQKAECSENCREFSSARYLLTLLWKRQDTKKKQPLFGVITVGAIVLGVVGIGATVLSNFHEYEVTRELVRALGEALLIAGFIAVTVDQYVKKRLLWETSHDIAKYLIGYNLPPEVQDQIHLLMGTALVRRDFRHTYMFEEVDGRIKLTVRGEYKIENCSNTDQPYTPHLDFEKHEEAVLIEFRCDSADENARDLKGPEAQESDGQKPIVNFSLKEIKVQPVRRGITYNVSYKFFRLVKPADSDLIAFHGPTIGVTISAECPNRLVFDGGGDATIKTTNRWEYTSIFLKGQHLHPRWSPRDAGNSN